MRQLHIREPWADLVYTSEKELLDDLVARIQILEAKIRELEVRVTGNVEAEREEIPVGV